MKKLALAVLVCFISAPAFAAEQKTGAMPMKDTKSESAKMAANEMGFMPHKATNEAQDKKDLEAMFKSMEDSMKKGDMSSGMASVDFPVLMVTDDSKGEAMTATWDKDMWTKTMSESMKKMPADMMKTMKHDRKYDFVTDSLAVVTDNQSMTMGGKKMSWKTVSLMIKKDGKWMSKAMVEGGWGDSMKGQGAGGSGNMGTDSGGTMK